MTDDLLSRIDEMIAEIERYKIEPRFGEELAKREAFSPEHCRRCADFLRLLCHLIAFSQQSRPDPVKKTFPLMEGAFAAFDPATVAHMDPEDVIDQFWARLGALRFKRKIPAMIRCGGVVLGICADFATPIDYIRSFGIPERMRALEDVPRFWQAFDALLGDLTRRGIPFFGSTTSLCHLLMVLGFPCNKPDSAVMAAASALRIVPARRSHSDEELRRVVRAVQEYSIIRGTRPAVVDIYFLIRGGQSGEEKSVLSRYYDALQNAESIDPSSETDAHPREEGSPPSHPPIRRDLEPDEKRCVNARRWRARPATVTIGETGIEGTVVDESDEQTVIFMPWGESAEYLPFRIARESVCVHPWNSPHARIRAFRQVVEAVLGRPCWLRVQTIAGRQGDAQERVTEIGRIFFGDNWARHYVPQHVFEEEVLRIRQADKEPLQTERTGLLLAQATKVRR